MADKSISDVLGLRPGMRTYFAHPPSDYFDKLGYRPLTFRPDDDGMYDFIHAFFTEKEQLQSSSQILTSKLADDGRLWISWPINGSDINETLVQNTIQQLHLQSVNTETITEEWASCCFTWKN